MSGKLDDFKAFVKEYPLLKDEVREKRRTWQQIFEEWYLDNSHDNWKKFKVSDNKVLTSDNLEEQKNEEKKEGDEEKVAQNEDLMKTLFTYARKIDPNSINKTIDSVQKVMNLVGSFSGASLGKEKAKPETRDPLFDRRFDDWY